MNQLSVVISCCKLLGDSGLYNKNKLNAISWAYLVKQVENTYKSR